MNMPTGKPELPPQVVLYNFWTDFHGSGIGKCFEKIPYEELINLAPGSTVWLDSEMPSGKVDTFLRAEVIRTREHPDGTAIEFQGPMTRGSTVVQRQLSSSPKWHKVYRCVDEPKLLEMIKKFPLALEPGTVGTMSPVSAAYLRSIGASIVPVT